MEIKTMQDEQKQDAPPKKTRWRVTDVLGIIFSSLIVSVLALVIFVDVEFFRKSLTAKISEATGYQVKIQTLDISFYSDSGLHSSLGLKAEGLQVLSESRELFSADSLFIKSELESLLQFFLSSFKEGTAKFELEWVRINEIDLKEMAGGLVLSRGNIQLIQGHISPEHGEVSLTGNYKIDQQSFDMEFSTKSLRAEDFLKDNLSGALQLTGKLQGRLDEAVAIKDLSGKANVSLSDGRILIYGFREEKERDGFGYKHIDGDVALAQGALFTDNLKLNGSDLELIVKGKLDLPTRWVEGKVEATLPFLKSHYSVTGPLDMPGIQLESSKSILPSPQKILEGILNITEFLLNGEK